MSTPELHEHLAKKIVSKVFDIGDKIVDTAEITIALGKDIVVDYLFPLVQIVGKAYIWGGYQKIYASNPDKDPIAYEKFLKYEQDLMQKTGDFAKLNIELASGIIAETKTQSIDRFRQIIGKTHEIIDQRIPETCDKFVSYFKQDMIEKGVIQPNGSRDQTQNPTQNPTQTQDQVIQQIFNTTNIHQFDTEIQELILSIYQDDCRESYRISESTVKSMRLSKEFVQENGRLNKMIEGKCPLGQIAVQRNRVDSIISDKATKEHELVCFTTNLNSCGQIASGLCAIMGNHKEAQDIAVVTSFACQSALVYAGFNALGPMAGLGPLGLSLVGISAIVGLVGGLLSKSGGDNGMHIMVQMMKQMFEAISELRETILRNFDLLHSRLNNMERNIITQLLEIKELNEYTIKQIKQLSQDMMGGFASISSLLASIDYKLDSLDSKISNEHAKARIREVSKLVGQAFHNLDRSKYESFRSALVTEIIQPDNLGDSVLVDSKFETPILSLDSIINETNPSKISWRSDLSNLAGVINGDQSNINWIAPILNPSQLINSPIPELNSFHSYYASFNAIPSKQVGIFIFAIENSCVFLVISKWLKQVKVSQYFNRFPITFITKLKQTLRDLGLDIKYEHDIFTEQTCSYKKFTNMLVSQLAEQYDTSGLCGNGSQTNYPIPPTIQPIVSQSVYKMLHTLMLDQYLPRKEEEKKYSRISHGEINQLIQTTEFLQVNFEKIELLADKSNASKLLDGLDYHAGRTRELISAKLHTLLAEGLERVHEEFVGTVFVPSTHAEGFVRDITVSQNGSWRSGLRHTIAHNRGGTGWHPNEDGSGHWPESEASINWYLQHVVDKAKEKMGDHLSSISNIKNANLATNYTYCIGLNANPYETIIINEARLLNILRFTIPFYIYPEANTMDGLVLPINNVLRTYYINTFSATCLKVIPQYCYFGFAKLSMRYTLDDEFCTIKVFLVHANHQEQLVLTNKFECTPYMGQCVFHCQDRVFTKFCGGPWSLKNKTCYFNRTDPGVGGRRYDRFYEIQIPDVEEVKGLTEDADKYSLFKQSLHLESIDRQLLQAKIDGKIKSIYQSSFTKVFEPFVGSSPNDAISVELSKYLEQIQKIKTWDLYTYQMARPGMEQNLITRKDQIIKFFQEGQFDAIYSSFDSFATRFDPTNFIREYRDALDNTEIINSKPNQIFSSLIQESFQLIAILEPYIVPGLSTGAIVEKMGEELSQIQAKQRKLMKFIESYKLMDGEEQKHNVSMLLDAIESGLGTDSLKLLK